MSKQVSVIIVDDSPTMRAILKSRIERDPGIVVVGEAGDPYEAREAIKALSPDVITLDVNMPRMDGLEFLEKIMRLRPTPVIMVSSEVAEGAAASIAALEMGAFDCVAKPASGKLDEAFASLPAKLKAAARAPVKALGAGRRHVPQQQNAFRPSNRLVAIGASTGGVDALLSVLSAFPANCPPTVVTQHMPPSFTTSFANRLNQRCAASVSEATHGAKLEIGKIYLAPGGLHLEIGGAQQLTCRLREGDLVSGHRPSVDVLFDSVAKCGRKAVGVILTGMGSDGARGLLNMREMGASTIGQDEASSLVYGMPRAAHAMGAVQTQLCLDRIPAAILDLCASRSGAAAS